MSIKKLKMSQYLHDIYFKLKLQPSTPINLYHFLPTFTNFLSLYYFFQLKRFLFLPISQYIGTAC